MTVPSTSYQEIINWAQGQQEYEALNHEAAPITPAQQKALQDLLQHIKPPPIQPPEPELGSSNWVGLLHRYRDAHPDASGLPFKEKSVNPKQSLHLNPQRWTCYVVISENDQPFPGASRGLMEATGEAPTFLRKKDAKQYAAKCAVEWLRENGFMPDHGDQVKFPNGMTPPAVSPSPKRQKMASVPPAPASDDATSSWSWSSSCSSSSSAIILTHDEPSPSIESTPSAASRVASLCRKLGFQVPSYKLKHTKAGYWSGYPEFEGIMALRFPSDLGHVKNVLGESSAKEMIAEEVLKELQKVEAEREEIPRKIMGNSKSAPS